MGMLHSQLSPLSCEFPVVKGSRLVIFLEQQHSSPFMNICECVQRMQLI